MRFIFSLLLTAIFSWICEQFFPWYSVAVIAFLVAWFMNSRGLSSFISGALGVGLLWLGYALMIDYKTDSILSEKIAKLIGLDESVYMLLITFSIGFLVGGLSAWSGFTLKKITEKKKREGYYL
jgi:hypothetical protein